MCDVSFKDRRRLNSSLFSESTERPDAAGDDELHMTEKKKKGGELTYEPPLQAAPREKGQLNYSTTQTNKHTHTQFAYLCPTQSSLYGLLLLPKVIRQCDPSAASTHTFSTESQLSTRLARSQPIT